MGKLEILSNANPLEMEYQQLSTRFDPEYGILWSFMNPQEVPCFNLNLLTELQLYHQSVEDSGGAIWVAEELRPIHYIVLASQTPGVFNLGGQLSLISQLVRMKDRQGLMHYATMSINAMMPRINHYNLPVITISLMQGDALGAGLEAALTSDIIIAERSSRAGFPEILFNLIPGHGAYSLAARKLGAAAAEKMILGGKIYSAEELHELGLVDMLIEDGEGEDAVYDYVRKQYRRSNGYLALQRARQRFNPVTYQELLDITTIWADAALQLRERDIKVMERFIHSQKKYMGPQHAAPSSSDREMELIYGGEMDRRQTV
ncbi:MAG: crotonase/enoyl-CoA hydratase family protein [Gallionellaceae bacterium]|nr:crotonase/enoyl-CoA hydratase family protein [Gallionellaceae bacterium]